MHPTDQKQTTPAPVDPAKLFLRVLGWKQAQPADTGDDSISLASFERMMEDQPVINLKLRHSFIELPYFKIYIQNALQQGQSRQWLLDRLNNAVIYYVRGQISAALLIRMGDMLRDGALRAVGAQYEMVYGPKNETEDLKPEVKMSRVEALQITSHEILIDPIVNNGLDFRLFLGILKSPAVAFGALQKTPQESHDKVAERITPSFTFLHVVLANEYIKEVFLKETGLEQVASTEKFEAAEKLFHRFLGNTSSIAESDVDQCNEIVKHAEEEKTRLIKESIRVCDELMKEDLATRVDLLTRIELEDKQEEERVKKLADVEEKLKTSRQATHMLRDHPKALSSYQRFINTAALKILKKEYFEVQPHPDLAASEIELSNLETEYESCRYPIPKHTENTPEIKKSLPVEIAGLKTLLLLPK